jgi:hypothetical protein
LTLLSVLDRAADTAMNPYTYTALRTAEVITIDGKGDEPAWNRAAVIDGFVDIRGEQAGAPQYHTRVRMLWDDEFLYVLAELEEPHVWADITQRDALVYNNNAFEIFINPDDRQPGYVEFEVNALGTIWDLRLDRPYRDGGKADSRWTAPGLQWAVTVQGTLNNPADIDTGWSVEWAIPVRDISSLHGAPWPPNRPWRMNFLRVQWPHVIAGGHYHRQKDKGGNPLPAGYSVWTPQHAVDMHQPEHWGYVTFADAPL